MTTYTERYIHAATRSVEAHKRDDLAQELEASIGDAIAARVENGEPADVAERDVLVGLGDPGKLAADYADRPLMLIGPRYFLDWWRLLKLLLWIVLPTIAAVSVAVQVIAGEDVGAIIGRTVGLTITVGTQLCFWVTFGFAALEWAGPRVKNPMPAWTLDQLPELRKPGAGRADLVASLVFLILAATAVLWDRFIGFVPDQSEVLPILHPGLWPWWIVGLAAVMIAEGALAVAVYRRGRWTPTLAAINSILALVVAVPAVWLLVEAMLVNPAFVDLVAPTAEVAAIAGTVVGVSIVAVAVWDVIDGWYKVYRDSRG